MREKLPINAEVLKWGRISSGLTHEEVAQRLGSNIKEKAVRNWEAGEGSPTYPQLEKLAHQIYKRPVAVFFFPSVPQEDTPESDFRTLPRTFIDALPHRIIELYRKAKYLQFSLEELYDNKPVDNTLIDLFPINLGSDLVEITKELRAFLDIPLSRQVQWKSTNTAFKEWRAAFENAGIFVFKEAFKNSDYSGFCLYHNQYPLIFINNSLPDSRQIFTLFHELAHLLLKKGGIDFRRKEIIRDIEGEYREIEVFCNRFAGDFLIPTGVLDPNKLEVSEDSFNKLAEQYSVSREVILRKYLDFGLIDSNYYEGQALKWSEQFKKKERSGGDYYLNKITYLGERYINIAFREYYQNRISIDALAEYLGIRAKNIPNIEHKIMERG